MKEIMPTLLHKLLSSSCKIHVTNKFWAWVTYKPFAKHLKVISTFTL